MIKTKSIEDPLSRFYSKYFFFSYSSIRKLEYSPISFYNWYILRDREDRIESHLIEGKVIHCLLLDSEMFNRSFIVSPDSLPGASNKKIVEDIYKIWKEEGEPNKKLQDYETEILKWLENNNLHQKLIDDKDSSASDFKTGNQKRVAKIIENKSISYFDYLKKSQHKDVIDQATLDRCKEAINNIKENKSVVDLIKLGQGDFELLEVYNEKSLQCRLEGYPFGLQGIIDNYVIDHVNKKIYINDLKTTSKSLREFKDSVEYYKYWMQAAIYERLVKCHNLELDYEIVFHFIVIDKYNQVYCFPVTKESMSEWQHQLRNMLAIVNYHYSNKDYRLPFDFAINSVTL